MLGNIFEKFNKEVILSLVSTFSRLSAIAALELFYLNQKHEKEMQKIKGKHETVKKRPAISYVSVNIAPFNYKMLIYLVLSDLMIIRKYN